MNIDALRDGLTKVTKVRRTVTVFRIEFAIADKLQLRTRQCCLDKLKMKVLSEK